MSQVWYASTSTTAPRVKHLLRAVPGTRWWGEAVARCGEVRRTWQPVQEFAYPAVFVRCSKCTGARIAAHRG